MAFRLGLAKDPDFVSAGFLSARRSGRQKIEKRSF
jgi:hypothetical protein